jgi:hypothetical protein
MLNQEIADKLALASENNLGLAYSLICDTWDACDMAGKAEIDRISWETTLNAAIDAYNANQRLYVFNPRAMV